MLKARYIVLCQFVMSVTLCQTRSLSDSINAFHEKMMHPLLLSPLIGILYHLWCWNMYFVASHYYQYIFQAFAKCFKLPINYVFNGKVATSWLMMGLTKGERKTINLKLCLRIKKDVKNSDSTSLRVWNTPIKNFVV